MTSAETLTVSRKDLLALGKKAGEIQEILHEIRVAQKRLDVLSQ